MYTRQSLCRILIFAGAFFSPLIVSSQIVGNNGVIQKPDATNTGYTSPLGELTPSGSITVRTDGAVIEGLFVSGRIDVRADNVTIRNCLIDAGRGSFYSINANFGAQNLLIEDCEIRSPRSACLFGSNFTARRCHLWDSGADAVKPSRNVVLESCFIEKLGFIEDSHADGTQMVSGGNFVARYCNYEMGPEPGYNNSIALIIQTNNGPIDDILIENNWINGGGYSIQINDRSHGHPTNVRILNNRFGRDYAFGPWIIRLTPGSTEPGTTISGNRWEDTGELMPNQSENPPVDDSETPSSPTGLNVTSISSTRIHLTWSAATDNIAVTRYHIYQDGVEIGNTANLNFTATGLSPTTSYSFTVSARDAAGNESPQSAPVLAVTDVAPPVPDLSDTLVAYWRLDEGNGMIATDTISGREGTSPSAPTWLANGQIGGAIDFDDSTSRLTVPAFDITGNELTLAAWVHPESFEGKSNEARFISKASSTNTNDHYWMLGNSDDGTALRFRLKTEASASTSTYITPEGLLSLDEWTHVAATYDGTTMRIYINGTEVGTGLPKTGSLATDDATQIGLGNQPTGAGDRALNGLLDEIRIYNKALNTDEIISIMGAPIDNWASTYNLPASLSPENDDDGDGIALLLEYALGTSPVEYSTTPVSLEFDGASATYHFPRLREELNYTVQISTDLVEWTTEGVAQSTAPLGEMNSVTITPPSPSDRVFVRLFITQ